MAKKSNILDPIHASLDPTVWDAADTPDPRLKPEHKSFIVEVVHKALERHGYDNSDKWLSLVLTGSLTTYQYSDQSDCDISLWVDSEVFPEWSRAEMIGIMISEVDAHHVTLPGTPHPLQCFVVASTKFRKEDLYKPGVRSGYDISTDKWIVPPDKSRVHDVKREEVEAYAVALENADKMEKLIRYEPDKAVMFYDQMHRRRMRDMIAGKGDFSPSNIAYKMLDQRGLLQHIAEISGRHIGGTLKTSMALTPEMIEQWIREHGPYLYHGAHPRRGGDPEAVAESVLQHGIIPGGDKREQDEYPGYRNPETDWDDEHDQDLDEWWHTPRPGHVYMVKDPNMAYGSPTFRVDLRKLDPQKIKADDDYLRDHFPQKLRFQKWTEPTPENPPATLGDQAQEIGWGDNTALTYDSLGSDGVVAHEGPVPPEAIERIG